MSMVNYWEESYKSIEKYNEPIPLTNFSKPKDLYKEALGREALRHGVDNYLRERLRNCTNQTHKTRVKAMIKEASTFMREAETSPLIEELDRKIQESVQKMSDNFSWANLQSFTFDNESLRVQKEKEH